MKASATWAIQQLAADTVMGETWVSECTGATDIRFLRTDLGTGIYGQADCQDWHGGTTVVCYAATAAQNLGEQVYALTHTDDAYSDGVEQTGELVRNFRATYCHEAGHTVGFVHHPDVYTQRFAYYDGSGAADSTHRQDCMVRGHLEEDQNWLRINLHHANHAAATYP